LILETHGKVFEGMVICSPVEAYTGPEKERLWGIFLPLYAIDSERSWGSDFTDLESLSAWVKRVGGEVVGTLPLLAAFLDEPCEPSPYAPASRLFWNEFYVDLTRIPELERCPGARAILNSSEFKNKLKSLRSAALIDYRREMGLKRKVMYELARAFISERSERETAFERFKEANPQVEDYARFRATCERRRSPWVVWPERLRDGHLRPEDYDEHARRYHLYVQWLAQEQLCRVAEQARASGLGLYLDLPLGVHPHGYDVWRERDLFAMEACGGAPPDSVFTQGQNWGFPPIHPDRIREADYRYMIAMVRHHLKYAGFLRIDHAMGLHRLFWVPKGLEPRQGVYVRYRAEELYAILSLESHRHQALIVGENLGTVPAYVNTAMARHNLKRMYVVQYELKPAVHRALPPVPRGSVASLNTHDMRPFATFLEGMDIQDRIKMGLLGKAGARSERRRRRILQRALLTFLRKRGWLPSRTSDPEAALKACLSFLSASNAGVVLINLEDLWLEREPQNIPSTRDESPNWQRKARYSFEQFSRMPEVLEVLREVDRLRKRGRA
jgi:4-alpha-glucanotransferase